MRKNILVSVSAISLLFLFTFYTTFWGNPIHTYRMVSNTMEHLKQKGYEEDNILSIESNYHFKRNSDNMSGVVSYVIFNDEPNIRYTYVRWKKSKNIQQHCTYYDIKSKSEKWYPDLLINADRNCTERDG